MSVRSVPRPVRTRKKKFKTVAPSSFARSIIAGTSPTFQPVTDMCREKSRPASRSTRVARTAPSQAPGILDIFAQHARTREGSLQVELAQYEYRLPRLTRMWSHLGRLTGGASGR